MTEGSHNGREDSLESTWLLKDILTRPFNSISWIRKPDVPEVNFTWNRRFDLFGQEAWAL